MTRKTYELIGYQETGEFHNCRSFIALYNLQVDIPGHPTGSTVTERTLKAAGIWKGD